MTLTRVFPGELNKVFGSRGGPALPSTGLIFYAKAPSLVDTIGLPIETLYPLVDPALRTIVSADGGTTKRDDADIVTLALANSNLNKSTVIGDENAIAIYAYLTTTFVTLAKACRALKVTWTQPSGPTAFSFTDTTGAELSTLTESAAITVAGLDVAVWFSVTGGEVEVNDSGTWVTSGVVINTDTVKVRRTSSSEYEDPKTVVLDINGVSDTWSLTTKSAISIASIFSNGEYGGAYDFSDASTLTKDAYNVVQTADDISPRSNALTMATESRRPRYAKLPSSIGPQLLVNPRFDSDTEYTKGAGWSIADGKATKTAGEASSLSVPVSFEVGETYIVFGSMLRSAGTTMTKFTGGTDVVCPTRNINSSFYEIMVAATGNTTLEIYADAAFAGSITNLAIHKVLTASEKGCLFDGVDDQIQSAMVMGGSHVATVAWKAWISDKKTASSLADISGTISPAVPVSVLVDATGTAFGIRVTDVVTLSTINPPPGEITSRRVHTFMFELDTSQTPLADQIKLFVRNLQVAEVISGTGSPMTDIAIGNGTLTLGGANNGLYDFCGCISKFFVVNRALADNERTYIQNWMNTHGSVGVIGDSTVATGTTSSLLSEHYSVSTMLYDYECSGADISYAGDKIADQKTAWSALTGKTTLKAVIVQVGQNDANTYAVSKTSAQIIADLQDLIDTIRVDVSASCKIIACALTPARGWLGNSNDPSSAYAHWLAINQAIEGGGATPITGVDAVVTGKNGTANFWNQLNDGSDYLLDIYDHNNDEVHISTEARWYVAQEWRAALQSVGV